MDAPDAYRDREQTFFKHQVLKQYLRAWSHKLASASQHGHRVRLWFVDCFAGPWESRMVDRADTSVAIGLSALEDALETWAGARGLVEARAIFVEANRTSAAQLRSFVAGREDRGVRPHVIEGEFGAKVGEIGSMIGEDPAFVFVDPTGWKGAGMGHITPLVARPYRDVMVNVMFHHINRWKDDPREFLRAQMRNFFGLGEAHLEKRLDEAALMALYRRRLRESTGLPHVADLAVPHPTRDQTFFRLVVGGRHPTVLRLFRDIEEKVVGRDAGAVRERARERNLAERTGQLSLGIVPVPAMDVRYQRMRDADLESAMGRLRQGLTDNGPTRFGELWPPILGDHHITRRHLAASVMVEVGRGRLSVKGMRDRERAIKDNHIVGGGLGAEAIVRDDRDGRD